MTPSADHTSKLIKGTLGKSLESKSIALCITGSVAAVECVALARLLMRYGAEVYAVMSAMAQKIIHPYVIEWATGNSVVTELTGQIEHITLAGLHDDHVDMLLVAPATANTIGKIANGIDDTPVTTTASSAIGAGIPVLIVPAMHESMYDHPAVLENIKKLENFGAQVMTPRMEEAKAKIPKLETIVEQVISTLGPQDLDGKHFVVTAGPTRGWIDRIRYVSNPSTGKMGIAIANEILSRGGTVSLVIGPTTEEIPDASEPIRVETTNDMLDAVEKALSERKTDSLISAAAVLDYTPASKMDEKTPSGKELSIELVPTPKIIDKARDNYKDLFIVGFKVESGVSDSELEAKARSKIDSGVCDLVVANDERKSGVAFGTDTNEVLLVGPKGYSKKLALAPKREIARQIVDIIRERLNVE